MQIAINQQTIRTHVTTINQSFFWMFIGLFVTGVCALFIASNTALVSTIYASSVIFYGIIIAELALVFFLSFRITSMSYEAALVSFLAYACLNGITLSVIFLTFTSTSLASTFFITSAVFGVMAFYGYTTKRDLTSVGNLAFMALIGIIIASIVNLFLRSNAFTYLISYLSVVIFIGLTAFDTQKIKELDSNAENQNLGILGALTLYLDFINIFLNLLRILGKRRND